MEMDEITQDAIGKALYDACATVLNDGIEWQDVLAKHVYVKRAQAVFAAFLACDVSHSQGIRVDDDTGRDV